QQLEQSCDFYQCSVENWLNLLDCKLERAGPSIPSCFALYWYCSVTCSVPLCNKNKNLSSNTHQTEHVQCLRMICLIRR
ncbi:unnamed protein product, partial [Staurois parvus]